MALAYHLLFVRVEYDNSPGRGGGNEQFVLLSVVLVDAVGINSAFKKVTGLSPRKILNYTEAELYTSDGEHAGDHEDVYEDQKIAAR